MTFDASRPPSRGGSSGRSAAQDALRSGPAAEIARLLERSASLDPSALSSASFAATLAERARRRCEGDLAAYLRLLAEDTDELERLVAAIAVPETWLFRYPRSFELLLAHLGSIAGSAAGAERSARPPRLLSVGCASGAEPFAIAMCALHAGAARDAADFAAAPAAPPGAVVEAVDRSPEALAIAASGRLGPAALRGGVPAWAERHLRRDSLGATVGDEVLRAVRFRRADALAESWGTRRYDAIFCRNVCVYLSRQARGRLLTSLAEALVEGGLLLLGHADSVVDSSGAAAVLHPVRSPHTFAWRRGAASAVSVHPATAGVERQRLSATEAPPRGAPPAARPTPAPLSRHVPASASAEQPAPPAPVGQPAPPAPLGQPAPPADSSGGRPPTLADALALANAGETAGAASVLRGLAARGEVSAEACELDGVLALARGDLDAARRFLEKAVYLEPQRSSALLHLAMVAERRGDPAAARRWKERARRADREGS